MNKPIRVGLASARILRLIIVGIVLVLAGRSGNTDAQTLTNLHSFVGSPHDGSFPQAGLVQGRDGNFYGTTGGGGTSTNCSGGCGTVYKISSSGSLTNLYSFGSSPSDGENPAAGLVQGSDGNFYGTTYDGGTSNVGTVFRISTNGSYTNLYSFGSSPHDGSLPQAGLVQGGDGNFYGTTQYGGMNGNLGTMFRISASGNYTNLYSFGGSPGNGEVVYARLVLGNDGNFYGTTYEGGTNDAGTVFRISPSGNHTNLHLFGVSPSDGENPTAELVQGSDGNFYGTTSEGGTNGDGTVFRISPGGGYTNLHSFVALGGAYPFAGLVQGSDGNFYGTTYFGGTNGDGNVFRISPSGSFATLWQFSGNDGRNPQGALVQGSDDSFYSTTYIGGTNNEGAVFKLTVPLNPPPYPINQITGVGLSGTNIIFNIPSIAYETYQLQFSSSLNPTNWVDVPNVSITNSIGGLLTVTNFGGALQPQGFYRFDITP
jgi:uncharacterized repeat protein (TIGR03803 family)